ncbi:MAG: hypothetical protein RLY70_3621 [Planctomycetota bacterium]|jgi:hypothetical protein
MNCQQLAERIERLAPAASLRDVARLCLLLANHVEDPDALLDDNKLAEAWARLSLRMQAATDQHAAMIDELEDITDNLPTAISGEQVRALLRAIRVQGQMLNLYVHCGEADRQTS